MDKLNTLITSGSYIGEEMQAEFGRIPPAFLPVGSTYLLQHQLFQLKDRAAKSISLPVDYELTAAQQRLVTEHRLSIIRVDPLKSLGLSVFQSLLEIGTDCMVEIFHGDTLISAPPKPADNVFFVETAPEQYRWGLVEANEGRVVRIHDADLDSSLTDEALILSGYFAFSDSQALLKYLVIEDFSFLKALDNYCRELPTRINTAQSTLDFGHLKTFYGSRRSLAAARHFNNITVDAWTVRKSSTDSRKIDAEANWLREAPKAVQPFIVRLVEDRSAPSSGEYSTLYGSFPTVSELYLARSPQFVWQKVLASCLDFLNCAKTHEAPDRPSPFSWLVVDKLRDRIADYPDFLPDCSQRLAINGQRVGTLDSIIARIEAAVGNAPSVIPSIMHGDFCFSNMLFDLRSDRIQLIDPRGLINGEMTLYGDVRYDIAKLGHSIIGRYDEIVGEGLFAQEIKENVFTIDIPANPMREWLEKRFLQERVGDIAFDSEQIHAAMVSLFLSMIPLHTDAPNRQLTFFVNALRLFARFFGEND